MESDSIDERVTTLEGERAQLVEELQKVSTWRSTNLDITYNAQLWSVERAIRALIVSLNDYIRYWKDVSYDLKQRGK